MTDKLTQTQELSRFLCQEQIICKYKFQDKMRFDGRPYCTCFSKLCEDLSFICDDNCQIYEDYKQLKHKEQECEELKEQVSIAQERYTTMRPHAIELADTNLKLQKEVNTLKQALDEIGELAKCNNFLVRDPFCGSGYRDLSGQILGLIRRRRMR